MTLVQTLVDTAMLSAEWARLARPRLRQRPRTGNGHRLAFFAWALPPHSSGGVHRPLSFLRYGCQAGWHVDAFCGESRQEQTRHGDELVAKLPPQAALHVIAASSRDPSYSLFPRVDGGFPNALEYARYACAVLAEDPPDVVLASGPPFFTFVAALLVARRFGVPLVLDYRDEWTECPFDFVHKEGHDLQWERRCLARADAVFFTTGSHMRHQLDKFPELDSRKAHLVPNGYEPDDFVPRDDAAGEPRTTDGGALRLTHVGTLAAHTHPRDFLHSLEELLTAEPAWKSRIKIEFIGRRTQDADTALQNFAFPAMIDAINQVGKRASNRRMQETDILLLIANPDLERYLPGKLFDYLAARRPVLVFGSRGESSELVEQLAAGELCPAGSGSALRESLLRLRQHHMGRNEDRVQTWLQQHRREVLASRAFEIIESLARRR